MFRCEVKLPAFHTLLSPARSAPTPSAHPNPVYSVRQISRQVSGIPLRTQGISSQPPLQYSALPVLESFSSAKNISLHFSNLFSFHPYVLHCHILRAGEHGGDVYRSWSGGREPWIPFPFLPLNTTLPLNKWLNFSVLQFLSSSGKWD